MSHELRTPLNSIIVLSELIRENTASKEQNENFEYADMINSSSNELLRTINDILDLSKMEAGKMDINWGEVSVEDVTELVYHEFFKMAEKKQLSFEVLIEEEAPQMLVSDGQRLSQIIRNPIKIMLSNLRTRAVSLCAYTRINLLTALYSL